MEKSIFQRILKIFKREVWLFAQRPMFLFCIIIAPMGCLIFFITLMKTGLPTDLPAGIVDMDNTHITRIIARTIDALEETKIVAHYRNFTEAREAMQEGKIYAFFYIPKGTTVDALSSKQPTVSFYTNEAYFVAGTLLMRDLRTASELTGLALTRETLYARGASERQALSIIRPIVIEAHPLNNPMLNYSIYLNNILLPGILILLILLTTTYTIGYEWKQDTQKEWYKLANGSSLVALTGKLLPQTVIFSIIIVCYDVVFYKILGFPCLCGIWSMIALGVLTVLASQAFGVFLFGLFTGFMRIAMCLSALWGILSFSICGFTFPVTAMHPVLKALAYLFPLRHYYLIYVNQALDGNPIGYVWTSVLCLLAFLILPLLVLFRYNTAFKKYKYIP
jgi:ABC-2 type transport system permease protein